MMPSPRTSMTFSSQGDHLERVAAVLAMHRSDDYYAYERKGDWFLGLGNHAALIIDAKGETVTTSLGLEQKSSPVAGKSISDIARDFLGRYLEDGHKVFGQAGFNYAAYTRGQQFKPGQWPLLSLLIPRVEITLRGKTITVAGYDADKVREICDFIEHGSTLPELRELDIGANVDSHERSNEYISRVKKALAEIAQGLYTKVIPSRAVSVQNRVNMPATLFRGRQSNNPARSFSLSHSGFQATGFSPELVMSVQNGKVITEPLAGTRSCKGSEAEVERLRQELLSDSKEIVEHVISVKEAIQELSQLCTPGTIAVEDFMSVRKRGPVQHLGSTVAGMLSTEKDIWDAFETLFPSITASGIPKNAAIEAIQRLESQPRELYSGAVLMLENEESLEAALVLRTVFQDSCRQWIQAGAGVILQSNPERELTETCEKLASIAPFVVADS